MICVWRILPPQSTLWFEQNATKRSVTRTDLWHNATKHFVAFSVVCNTKAKTKGVKFIDVAKVWGEILLKKTLFYF